MQVFANIATLIKFDTPTKLRISPSCGDLLTSYDIIRVLNKIVIVVAVQRSTYTFLSAFLKSYLLVLVTESSVMKFNYSQ